jgi:hypothetical protein
MQIQRVFTGHIRDDGLKERVNLHDELGRIDNRGQETARRAKPGLWS